MRLPVESEYLDGEGSQQRKGAAMPNDKRKQIEKIMELLDSTYAEGSVLRQRLEQSLEKKLSANDLSSLYCVVLSSRPRLKGSNDLLHERCLELATFGVCSDCDDDETVQVEDAPIDGDPCPDCGVPQYYIDDDGPLPTHDCDDDYPHEAAPATKPASPTSIDWSNL